LGFRVFNRLPLAFDPMTTQQFLSSAWTWNLAPFALSGIALAAYVWAFGLNRRIVYLLAGLGTFVLTLISPLNELAAGYLFSAHMLQHILLLLIVPALLLMSLPSWVSLGRRWLIANPLVGWMAGVGAMWLWHARPLCNAAVSSQLVSALQISSLLLLGAIFWRQILAPREEERMWPPAAVLYLFSACVACSILGILITFSPVSVCPIYANAPADRLGILNLVQSNWGITPDKDQQIGGPAHVGADVPRVPERDYCATYTLVRASYPERSSNGQAFMTDERHTNVPAGWELLPPETLPRPNFFPAGLAMGITFILWGLITSWVILGVGIGLFTASFAGWIYEILRE
jgi:putative membrane protein